jgi:5'-3' exonuclease
VNTIILLDYSQSAMSLYFVLSKNSKVDYEIFRYELLNKIRNVNINYKTKYGKLVICCDGGNSWRKQMFPYYKAKRKKDKDESSFDWAKLFEYMNQVRDDLKNHFNFPVIHLDCAEGDDIIAAMVLTSPSQSLILSSDKDFVQLQMHKDVVQYDFINEKWVKHDDPKRYLFEHVIKGDAGDGVPNIFSDDDTFLVQGKRQKPISSKKLDEWYNSELGLSYFITEKDHIEKYNRNKKLIDLRKIPNDVVEKIMDEFLEQNNKKHDIMKYFVGKNLGNLLEKIGDFKC